MYFQFTCAFSRKVYYYSDVFRRGPDFLPRGSPPILKQLQGVFYADSPLPVPPGMDYCPYARTYQCDGYYPYRSFDGSCNNLHEPLWGRSMVPFNRYIPSNYHDGKYLVTMLCRVNNRGDINL